MSEVEKILRKAREYITTYGWIKDDYGSPATGFCLTGACRAAADVMDDREHDLPPVLRDVFAAFTKPLEARGKSPFRYSDVKVDIAPPGTVSWTLENIADQGEIIEYNDTLSNEDDVLALLDDAITYAAK